MQHLNSQRQTAPYLVGRGGIRRRCCPRQTRAAAHVTTTASIGSCFCPPGLPSFSQTITAAFETAAPDCHACVLSSFGWASSASARAAASHGWRVVPPLLLIPGDSYNTRERDLTIDGADQPSAETGKAEQNIADYR